MGALNEVIAGSLKTEFAARVKRHEEAQNLVDSGKKDSLMKAAVLFRENVQWSASKLGDDHAATVYDQEQLSDALNRLQDFQGAKEVDEKVLETRSRVEGREPSKHLLNTEKNLAHDYLRLMNVKKAAELYEKNYQARRKYPSLGEDDHDTLQAGHDLGSCYYRLGEFLKASGLHKKILERRVKLKAPDKYIILSRESLALDHYELRNFESAKLLNQVNIEALKALRLDLTLQKVLQDAKTSLELCEQEIENGRKRKEIGERKTARDKAIASAKKDARALHAAWKKEKGLEVARSSGSAAVKVRQEVIQQASDTWKRTQLTLRDQPHGATPPMAIPPPTINVQPDHHRSHSLPKQTDIQMGTQLSGESGKSTETQSTTNSQKPRPLSEIYFRHVPSSDALSHVGGMNPEPSNQKKDTGLSPTTASGSWPQGKQTPSSRNPQNSTRTHRNSLTPSPGAKPNAELDCAHSTSPHQDKTTLPVRAKSASQASLRPKHFHATLTKYSKSNLELMMMKDFETELSAPKEQKRIKSREDFLDSGRAAIDTCGHGTHCVGVLRKVAPEADIYVARLVRDFDSELKPSVVAQVINRTCKDKKDIDGKKNWDVDILTMSLGFYEFDPEVNQAIQNALARPRPVLIFVAASNNGNMRQITFPANIPGIFCINSATAEGNPSDFNPPLDPANNFSILGVNVKSAWIKEASIGKAERVMSGTSVATPILAAVAALVLELALQDADEDNILKEFQDHLRRYIGMKAIFSRMHQPKLGYKNIVP